MRRLSGFHPFLFAVYPAASLLASNLGQVDAADSIRSILVSVVAAAVLLLLVRLVVRDWSRAALITSGALLVFFSYGHVYGLVKSVSVGGMILGRHRYLVPLALGIMVIWTWWVTRRASGTGTAGVLFSAAGVVAFVLPLYSIGTYYLVPAADTRPASAPGVPSAGALVEPSTPGSQPDIYYIILDAYAGEDVLRDLYGYDNTEFVESLERRGFFVASGSRSNYMMTHLSLASSLNMEYLDEVAAQMDPESEDLRPLAEMMAHSTVRSELASRGYQMVSFESGWPPTEVRDVDIFVTPGENHVLPDVPLWALSEFDILLLQSSLLRPALDKLQASLQAAESPFEWPYLRHRDRILFALDTIRTIPDWEGDYFVLAHLIIPHPPFVFGPSGESLPHDRPYSWRDGNMFEGSLDEYRQGYRDQVAYINNVLMRLVDHLLASSETEPVIILQGDHGPRAFHVWGDPEATNLQEAFSILNAYYLPWEGGPRPYESISPVNSFRIVLGGLFGEDLEMLPDESYFVAPMTPYDQLRVTDRVGTE